MECVCVFAYATSCLPVSVYVLPHLFEQSEDVNGEEAHGGGEDEPGLLQVRHVALVGAHQIHHRIHQGVTSV